jgi:hypothetical protein
VFRYGIVSRDQIASETPRRLAMPGIALTLLADFREPLSDNDEAQLATIYNDLGAGPFNSKRTFPHRCRIVDEAIEIEIEKTYKRGRPIHIHEMAASNAITSLELFERLNRRFGEAVSVRATDFFDAIFVVSVPQGWWRVVFDAEGQPLQFVGKRMVISARQKERRRYPINRAIRKILMMTVLPKAATILSESKGTVNDSVQRIELFHPRCLAMARSDNRFSLGRENIFEPGPPVWDILRIMNLTRSMPLDRAKLALANAGGRIVDGGLLVLGDSPDDGIDLATTIFQRQAQRLVAIRDVAGGYEKKRAVLDMDLSSDAVLPISPSQPTPAV